MAREDGQATVEYLGVVAVVAALFAAVAVPALAGRDVAGVVVREVRRALCVVSGGECYLDRRPCVVASRAVRDEASLDLTIVKLGSRRILMSEQRSDGTVAVTLLGDRQAGLDLTLGGGAHLRLGRRMVSVGAQAEATMLATLGSGSTWVLRDARSADRLVRSLAEPGGEMPAPTLAASRRGLAVSLGASAGAVGVQLGADDLFGVATDRATGRRTFAVRRRNDVAASLSLRGQSAGGALGTDELYTVTVDRDGRPVDLGVMSGRDASGEAGALQRAVRRESEEHLDLTDPENLAAARDFLREVPSPRPRLGRAVEVSGALRARLDEDGVLDERAYAVSDSSDGVGAETGTGLGHLGADYEHHEQRLRLVAARQRGPDGLWRAREDCVRAG